LKKLLSGNMAIALGAYTYGVTVGAGYPGTPSTEILEEFARYEGVYAEWAPNEKVALEVCLGAALAGARAMATMKHVGVNVAADPLMTAVYTGVNGGFLLISADDPSMHSSQNEQDNRILARFAKMPVLEPSDSQEAYDMVGLALEISETFDIPVMLRTTTRIAHSQSLVTTTAKKPVLKSMDILLVGVGGQGIILASKVLASAGQAAGYDVKVSEIHGMAQRGGSVVTQVRLGEKVYSPLIGEGGADFILAFEQLEGLRYLPYSKPDGTVIVSEQIILPVPVLARAAEYPPDIAGFLRGKISATIMLDAGVVALRCGEPRSANMVLLGVLARRLPIELPYWEQALAEKIPERILGLNQAAFSAGYTYTQGEKGAS